MTQKDFLAPPLRDRLLVAGPPPNEDLPRRATDSYASSLRPTQPGQPPFRTKGSGEIQPLLDRVLGHNHVVATRVSPGSATQWHTHDCDQVLVVTSGVATIDTTLGRSIAAAGTVIFIPEGVPHAPGSTPDSAAETVFLTATGHATDVVDPPS